MKAQGKLNSLYGSQSGIPKKEILKRIIYFTAFAPKNLNVLILLEGKVQQIVLIQEKN